MLAPRLAVLAAVVAAATAAAAPPTLDIPPEVRPAGQYVQFVPKTTAVAVEYVGLDGVEPFPSAFLKDARAFVLDSTALQKDKAYRFVAVGAGKNGEQARAAFVVVNGKVPPPPPKTEPDPKPKEPDPKPKDPPPAPASLYLLVVRPDGPAAPAFTRTMGDPAWAAIRAAGHLVKDMTLSEAAAARVAPPAGTQLPAVMVLEVSADRTRSRLLRTVPLPDTSAGIADLPSAP